MRKQQVAKSQSIRWKRELRRLAAKEVSTTLRGQDKEIGRKEKDAYRRKARPQAYKIGYALESFLFWLSFIFFRAIWIMSAAAVEAFREEVDISGSLRPSSTPLHGTTAGQSGQTHQGPVAVVVEDEDAVPL